MTIIEWEHDGRDYSYLFGTLHHARMPILPIGSYVDIRNGEFHFELRVRDTVTYYEITKSLSIYILCDVVERKDKSDGSNDD